MPEGKRKGTVYFSRHFRRKAYAILRKEDPNLPEDWPQDGLRHGYGTYRLKVTGSFGQVADEMGNSEQIVRSDYCPAEEPSSSTSLSSAKPRSLRSCRLHKQASMRPPGRAWHDRKVAWWAPRDENLFERVNVPVTTSRDEWAEAFMDLAKLAVEGFETKIIRIRLVAEGIPYDKMDGTIVLLEGCLNGAGEVAEPRRLEGLRTVQAVRSKAKGHASGSEAHKLAQEVLRKHRTYAVHFEHVCTQVAEELEIIEQHLS